MTRDGKPAKRKEDSWQAQKSAKTRESILDGAIDCYARLGYSKTTTSTIVNSANVSRGAMAHHFSSLADVVQAAAEHIKNKRLADSRRRFSRLENLQTDESRVEAIWIYWKWLLTTEATAYYELREVSRTDKELNKVITRISDELDREYRKIIEELFPELDENPELETLSEDLMQYLLEGMAMDYRIRGKMNKKRVERLITYMGETMGKIWGATG